MRLNEMVGTKETWLWCDDTNLYSCSRKDGSVLILQLYMN